MTSPQLIPQDRPSAAELIPLVETDLGHVARFIAAQSGRSQSAIEAHLRWFWLENPARSPEQSLGFALRSAGELVGCILCSPQVFQHQGKQILLMGSSSFYVDQHYRGHGGRIFLQYSRLASRWPLFGTSANPEAASLWKAAGAQPISHSEGELFGVLHWPPVAEEFAHRQTSNRFVSRLAASSSSKLVALFRPLKLACHRAEALQPLASADQAADLIPCAPSEKFTALRDEPYLRWRYFSGRDATVAVFAFRNPESARALLVTVNQRPRGYRGQINSLNLLDVYPQPSPDEWLSILAALIARYSNSVDALVLRNLHPDTRKILCESGFHWRAFDAPTGWVLDRTRLLSAPEGYFVPADGDGLI